MGREWTPRVTVGARPCLGNRLGPTRSGATTPNGQSDASHRLADAAAPPSADPMTPDRHDTLPADLDQLCARLAAIVGQPYP